MNIRVTELILSEGRDELETTGCVAYDPDLRRDPRRLRKEVEIVDALIVRNQTRVDDALLGSGSSLEAIGRLGVSLDNIDLAATRDRAISVIYARNANAGVGTKGPIRQGPEAASRPVSTRESETSSLEDRRNTYAPRMDTRLARPRTSDNLAGFT